MRLRTAAATVFATAILLGGAASTASAGEITGNGKPTQGPAHANSICTFSGQNDSPTDPFPEGGKTQSYGQLVRQKVTNPSVDGAAPGSECNGHLNPLKK